MNKTEHWENVYSTKDATEVSWYAPKLEESLELIRAARLPRTARIIDIGGGASTLVDDLLDMGFVRPAVLDLSSAAIHTAQHRLGERAHDVTWLAGDVTELDLPRGSIDLWHDRAVFHFLTDENDRARYVDRVLHAVAPGGHVIVATFGPNGPLKCSGLDVARYDADGIHAEFGSPFEKLSSCTTNHVTPWGSQQEFVYCYCLRK